MKHQSRSNPWLLEYSREHVKYEFMMLRTMSQTPLPDDESSGLAHIESFVHHLRIVISFLYGTRDGQVNAKIRIRTEPNDVLAEEFCDDWSDVIKRVRDDEDTNVAKSLHRAHRELAHLTDSRTAIPDAKTWSPQSELNNLRPILVEFWKAIRKDGGLRFHPDATAEIDELISLIHTFNDKSGDSEKQLNQLGPTAATVNPVTWSGATGPTGPTQQMRV